MAHFNKMSIFFYKHHCIFQIEGSIWDILCDDSSSVNNVLVVINGTGLWSQYNNFSSFAASFTMGCLYLLQKLSIMLDHILLCLMLSWTPSFLVSQSMFLAF